LLNGECFVTARWLSTRSVNFQTAHGAFEAILLLYYYMRERKYTLNQLAPKFDHVVMLMLLMQVWSARGILSLFYEERLASRRD